MLEVLEPGLLTTVQDGGRPGLGSLGVSPGGAADPWSLAVANRLLDGDPGAAALEMTLAGPTLRILADTTVALAGADLEARIVETGRPIRPGDAVPVRAGWTLAIPGPAIGGLRGYLAVPGGLVVPSVLGSAATALGAGFGGLDGRPLRAGDRLAWASGRTAPPGRWPGETIAVDGGGAAPRTAPAATVRVLPGPHAARIGPAALGALVAGTWTVRLESDRVGLRLDGPPLPGAASGELASLGVTWGTVQVPPDGRPIVLLVDHQPTGGYPVVAVVIQADLPVLGQLRPGMPLRFLTVDEADAIAALRRSREAFAAADRQRLEDAGWDELWRSAGG